MALAVEAIRSKHETIISASAKNCISMSPLARFVSGQVKMGGRPGPPTVLSEAEDTAIKDLLVYAGSHRLGLTRAKLYANCIIMPVWCPGTQRRGRERLRSPPSLRGTYGFRYAAVASIRPVAYIRMTRPAWKGSTRYGDTSPRRS